LLEISYREKKTWFKQSEKERIENANLVSQKSYSVSLILFFTQAAVQIPCLAIKEALCSSTTFCNIVNNSPALRCPSTYHPRKPKSSKAVKKQPPRSKVQFLD
jgi:hypothetical protein